MHRAHGEVPESDQQPRQLAQMRRLLSSVSYSHGNSTADKRERTAGWWIWMV
jgi:hypothetical protein